MGPFPVIGPAGRPLEPGPCLMHGGPVARSRGVPDLVSPGPRDRPECRPSQTGGPARGPETLLLTGVLMPFAALGLPAALLRGVQIGRAHV